MERIRIGNNIAISWALYDLNGRIHSLEDKEVQLYVSCGGLKQAVTDYTIQGNMVSWVFLGTEQEKVGLYKLILVETDALSGAQVVDVAEAFRLVSETLSAVETGEVTKNISVRSVLTYSNLVGVESVDVVESSEDGGTNLVSIRLVDGNVVEIPIKNGSKGDTGATGATGATGPKGDKGDIGERGPAGITSVSAAIGTNDPTQAPSVNVAGPVDGALGLTFNNIKGAKGDQGEPSVAVDKFVTVEATAQTTAATDVLPATGDADTVYRVANWDGTQYDETAYTEYGWYNGAYKQLATRTPGIDDEPTANSQNLVKSGGVAAQISQLGQKVDEIYGTTDVADKYVFGGTSNVITFDSLSLAVDGDAIEFKVKCDPSASGAYAFARNGNNIAISLSKAILGIKSAANEWQTGFNASSGAYNFGAVAGNIDATSRTFRLVREGTSLKLYIEGTFYRELENAPTITFDRLGGVHSGNYWSGELDFFRYTHNGVTTELMDFAGYTVSGDVTITTHPVASGIVKDMQDDITELQTSASTIEDDIDTLQDDMATAQDDISDLQTEIGWASSVNASEMSLFADVLFNDKVVVSIPSMVEGFIKITDVSGGIFIGTENVMQMLNFPDGSVTYKGVTLTKSGTHIVLSGTGESAGYINLSDLAGYGTADAAVAATTLPQMPNSKYYLKLVNKSGTFNLYTRSKTSTFIDLLTQNAPVATINDISIYGAFLIYIQAGVTYNGVFDFALIPEGADNYENANLGWSDGAYSKVTKVTADGVFDGDFVWGDGSANAYEIAATTNTLLSKGVVCAWFGDSLSELKNLPDLVAEKMAITIKDCSLAGSPLTYSSEYYQDTGFMSLCSQIVAEDFSPCEDAINAQYNAGLITAERRAAKLANLATLAAIDFSTLDRIVVFAGTNDLGVASLTLDNFKSGFSYALQTLITAYPNLSIYVITPPYRTDGMDVRPNGLKITDIVDAMTEVCQSFAIPCYDFLALSGVNQYNAATWIPDGLHQSDFGDEEWSKRIARWLQSY